MTDIIGRLLDEGEKAQRKGHLLLAEVCRDASDRLGLLEHEVERLWAAIRHLSDIARERVAAARREGIEAAIEAAMRVPIPEDASVAEAHGRLAAAQDICARIGALLEENSHD